MKPLHIFLLVCVMIAWGYNFIIVHYGLETFPPFLLSALRFSLAGLAIIFIWRHPPAPIGWIIALALAMGIFKFSFLFFGMTMGAQAGLSSLLLQMQAFFTVIFAFFLLKERPALRQYGGMGLAFIGLSLIMIDVSDGSSAFIGILCVIAGAAFWGLSNIIMKKAQSHQPVRLMIWVSAFSSPILFALSALTESEQLAALSFEEIPLKAYVSVVYLSLIATLAGFGIWTWLMRLYNTASVAPFSLLVPLFGLGSAHLFLGESISPLTLIAAGFILVGLFINTVPLTLIFKRKPLPSC